MFAADYQEWGLKLKDKLIEYQKIITWFQELLSTRRSLYSFGAGECEGGCFYANQINDYVVKQAIDAL